VFFQQKSYFFAYFQLKISTIEAYIGIFQKACKKLKVASYEAFTIFKGRVS
jgi:hypothetical protein